jgi:hypothetical protein
MMMLYTRGWMDTQKRKRKIPPEVSAYMASISGREKGGKARALKLTPEQRSEIAKKAVAAREAKRKAAKATK